MLVIVSSIDFMSLFDRFAGLQSYVLSGKLTVEQYFKSLANESNSQESPFLHFLLYDPKEVRVLTDLTFLILGYQIKNPSMQPATMFFHFCTVVMDFLLF